MKYKILVDPVAREEILEAAAYIARSSPMNARRWYDGFEQALASLAHMPHRCACARENNAFEEDLRQLIYKSHRIVFTVQDDEVRVLHIRHTAMKNFGPEE